MSQASGPYDRGPHGARASRGRPGAAPSGRGGGPAGLLLAALLLLGAVAGGGHAWAGSGPGPADPPPIAARFAGERLGYDLSFLFFSRAAVGRLALEPAPPDGEAASPDAPGASGRRYVARLSAETKGFVGWVNRRRHVYASTLVPCGGGRRWCSRVFVKDLTERDRREVTTTYVNPARGLMTWTVERDGVVDEIGWEPISPGEPYDDMLAAFYNFRAGVYGPIEPGRRYEVRTIPVEGVRTFTIRVLAGDEEARARRKYDMGAGGFVIAVKVPKAIFRNEGEVFVWFSRDMVPLGGTVENYIGFGDVDGRLVEAVHPVGDLPGRPAGAEARRGRPGAAGGEEVAPQGVEREPERPPAGDRGR